MTEWLMQCWGDEKIVSIIQNNQYPAFKPSFNEALERSKRILKEIKRKVGG